MTSKHELDAIAREIDELHAAARRAFLARDFEAYQGCFTADLCYVQPDGKAIGRDQLMRDVARQMSTLRSADWRFVRESLELNADGTVSQVVRQTAVFMARVFWLFSRTWKINRHARYTLRETVDGWRMCAVVVIAESVS